MEPRRRRRPPRATGGTPADRALATLLAMFDAGLTAEQLSRLADLRVRARQGAFAADGFAGISAPYGGGAASRHPTGGRSAAG